jgi:hypothetical protein
VISPVTFAVVGFSVVKLSFVVITSESIILAPAESFPLPCGEGEGGEVLKKKRLTDVNIFLRNLINTYICSLIDRHLCPHLMRQMIDF